MNPQVTWYVAEFWNTISNLAMIGTSTNKNISINFSISQYKLEIHKPIHSAGMQWDPGGEEGGVRKKASMR